jgi:hypothetical protein
MRRREAIKLFKEICKCVPDAFVSSISLSPNTVSARDFELKINVSLEGPNLTSVENLVKKHGLTLDEGQGCLLIYESRAKSGEIQVYA